MSKPEQHYEKIPGTNLQIPIGELIVDKNTGIIGTPGSFYGEKSYNGMPIHPQTLEEYFQDKRDEKDSEKPML